MREKPVVMTCPSTSVFCLPTHFLQTSLLAASLESSRGKVLQACASFGGKSEMGSYLVSAGIRLGTSSGPGWGRKDGSRWGVGGTSQGKLFGESNAGCET